MQNSPIPHAARSFYKPRQVAEYLQVSYSMVLALIRRGELPAVYVGRLPRVRETDLAAYVDRERAP